MCAEDQAEIARLTAERTLLQARIAVLEGWPRLFGHLENLLKEHEDCSVLRGNELASMIAMLPDPVMWTGALRLPFLGVVTLTLRPMHTTTNASGDLVPLGAKKAVMHPAPVQGGD